MEMEFHDCVDSEVQNEERKTNSQNVEEDSYMETSNEEGSSLNEN